MYLRLALAAVFAIVLAGAGWKCYSLGKSVVQAEWDAEKAAIVIAAAEAEKAAQKAADAVASNVHQAAVKERIVYKTITKEVDRVANDCPASADFRMLHDAAATAEMPSASSTGANVSSVAAKDVAETVIDNYESCRDSMRRLEALQQIIRSYNGE